MQRVCLFRAALRCAFMQQQALMEAASSLCCTIASMGSCSSQPTRQVRSVWYVRACVGARAGSYLVGKIGPCQAQSTWQISCAEYYMWVTGERPSVKTPGI
eukprot:524825-Pelagomonas_calceolata.AAC.2